MAVRSALRLLVANMLGFEVGGEATDVAELRMQMQVLQPGVVLLEWGMADIEAITLLPTLRIISPHVRIVALSWCEEVKAAALAASADAFVSQVDPPERLLQALSAVQSQAHVPQPAPVRDTGAPEERAAMNGSGEGSMRMMCDPAPTRLAN